MNLPKALLLALAMLPGASPAAELKHHMTQPGRLLLEIDPAKPLSEQWRKPKGKWETADGHVVGQHLKTEAHGAVMEHPLTPGNFVISCQVKVGPRSHYGSLAIEGAAVHILRVAFALKGEISLLRPVPKTATMQERKVGPKKMDKRAYPFPPDEWHSLLIEILGSEVLVNVDGREFLYAADPQFAEPKNGISLNANGPDPVHFKDLRVYEAKPAPEWESIRGKFAQPKKSGGK